MNCVDNNDINVIPVNVNKGLDKERNQKKRLKLNQGIARKEKSKEKTRKGKEESRYLILTHKGKEESKYLIRTSPYKKLQNYIKKGKISNN